MQKNQTGKGLTVIIAIIALFALALAIYFFTAKNPDQANTKEDAMKTMEENFSQENTEQNKMTGEDKMMKDNKEMETENSNPDSMMEKQTKIIKISGVNFAFSQSEIKVKKGDIVRIEFTSEDGFHDWVIDEFNAATEQINTGNSSSVEFVADKTGVFEYYCSVGKHRELGMVGNLIVE